MYFDYQKLWNINFIFLIERYFLWNYLYIGLHQLSSNTAWSDTLGIFTWYETSCMWHGFSVMPGSCSHQCNESFSYLFRCVIQRKMVDDKGADHSGTAIFYQTRRHILLSGDLIWERGAFITVSPASLYLLMSACVSVWPFVCSYQCCKCAQTGIKAIKVR